MEIIIVTGMSGAGKSNASHCLEDLGYYCVDNIPPRLISNFLSLAEGGKMDKLAFVMDIRIGLFFDELDDCIDELDQSGIEYKLMFLDASDEVLVRRYKETRRSHPLMTDGSLQDAISRERIMIQPIRDRATTIIDTSNLKVAQLNEEIKNSIETIALRDSFTITVESFGFKYGVPQDADWILDVRFLPNPFYVASLKKLTGRSKKVKDYVFRNGEAGMFVETISELAMKLIPSYIREGKYTMVLAIGCTGGQHRSVVIAEALAEELGRSGRQLVLLHRELQGSKK